MRNRLIIFTTALSMLTMSSIVFAGPQSPRQRILMDAGWSFCSDDPIRHEPYMPVWRMRPASSANEAVPTDTSGPEWKDVRTGEDTFHGQAGFQWWVQKLSNFAAGDFLHFQGVDDNATVYLNGKLVCRHKGWDDPFDVPATPANLFGNGNVLAVLVENTGGPGGITGPVTLGPELGSLPPPTDRRWRSVHLPHDYVVEGKFTPKADTGHGSLPVYPAWYEKVFTLPSTDKGKSIWIDFDGVYRDAKVYLNGRFLGEHQSGYTPFRFDISTKAHFGAKKNVLTVHVDPRHFEGWWYEGGGIYRHVWLNIANPVHIAPWGVYVRSDVKNVLTHPSAKLIIETDVDGRAGSPLRPQFWGNRTYLTSTVFDPSGKKLISVRSPVAPSPPTPLPNPLVPRLGEGSRTLQTVTVARVALWSIEKPRLYRLHSELVVDGKVVDAVDTPFGIRTIRFDANKGFFLNERHVKIQGVCNHQDFAGLGVALPDSMEYWRVKKLKEMGCNAWRTSHNPPNAEVLDACDRLGMLVMDENRHLGDTFSAKTGSGTPYDDMSEVDAMVLRDRNHPSVIMWSMCNEEGLQNTDEGAKIFAAMRNEVRRLDPTRPVTVAMNSGEYGGISAIEDIVGFNYNIWAYDGFHKQHPSIPLYGSETSSEVSTRGVYDTTPFRTGDTPFEGVPEKGWVNEYGVNVPGWANSSEDAWSALASRPFMAGGFVWTGFDYKGEPTPFGWPDINSNFGIYDEAGFPKDRFYYYQSVWTKKPMVHLMPHWNWAGKEGQPIRVWVYSNAKQVELILNGKSLGVKDMPRWSHAAWDVPYAPGWIEARGITDGKTVAVDRVETTGPPAALRLRAGRLTLAADGEDVIPVEVDVVDAKGRIVPTAGNLVTFAVKPSPPAPLPDSLVPRSGEGSIRIAGVGNGNPSDHDPDKSSERRAFAGKCRVLIGDTEHPGRTAIVAYSPGLKSASINVTAK